MIKEFTRSKDGNDNLAPHFAVREFACKDGSDKILIDTDLVDKLEYLRLFLETPIQVTSGYRTPAYNKKVGGVAKSHHLQGTAADVKCEYGAKLLARTGELLGFKGIGYYIGQNFTHLDTRQTKSYWYQERSGCSNCKVTDFFTKSEIKWIQNYLTNYSKTVRKDSFNPKGIDGIWGKNSMAAFRSFCLNAKMIDKVDLIIYLKGRDILCR